MLALIMRPSGSVSVGTTRRKQVGQDPEIIPQISSPHTYIRHDVVVLVGAYPTLFTHNREGVLNTPSDASMQPYQSYQSHRLRCLPCFGESQLEKARVRSILPAFRFYF